MTTVFWTARAQADLAAIQAFVEADSPHFASVVIRRVLRAAEQLQRFPQIGRAVPEYSDATLRELIFPPYRIVYRIVDLKTIHVLTVHHAARSDLRPL